MSPMAPLQLSPYQTFTSSINLVLEVQYFSFTWPENNSPKLDFQTWSWPHSSSYSPWKWTHLIIDFRLQLAHLGLSIPRSSSGLSTSSPQKLGGGPPCKSHSSPHPSLPKISTKHLPLAFYFPNPPLQSNLNSGHISAMFSLTPRFFFLLNLRSALLLGFKNDCSVIQILTLFQGPPSSDPAK